MINSITKFLFQAILCTWMISSAFATTYYVSPSGNDNNNGTSTSTPWKTIAKVNTIASAKGNKPKFAAGDQIFFQGGQTFAGNLSFPSGNNGTATSPITVSSYGTGPATIYASSGGDAIALTGDSYLTITNINVAGLGWNVTNGSHGVELAGTSNHCVVDHLTASGFHKEGVDMASTTHDNSVTFVTAQQNGFVGIHIQGTNQYVSDCQAISNNGDSTVTNNWSGSGIFVESASNVTVQYSYGAFNGANQTWTGNGPVGIWCWNSNHITFSHCISCNNSRGVGATDGGGFDLDGGTTYSLIEYCYSYNNTGVGYLLYNFSYQNIPHNNNAVRYCISENDGGAGIGIGTAGVALQNEDIYNVVAYNTNGSHVLYNYGGTMTNVNLRNNIFLTNGNLAINSNGFNLQGNCYYSSSSSYAFDGYGSNFTGWANGTGKEILNSQIVGLNVNPQLANMGNGTQLTNPRLLTTLTSYSPSASSPVVNAGLNLLSLFGINTGGVDFIGQATPYGPAYDMGAFEYQGAAVVTPTGLMATAGNAQIALNWNTLSGAISYNVKRSTVSGGPYTTIANVTTTSYTDTGLTNGTAYYYVVSAITSGGETANSTEASAISGIAFSVNSGGNAAGLFTADSNFSGGVTSSYTAFIDTSAVTNPAPQQVYQTERWGNMTYTFSGLKIGASYKVRLHFAEVYWNAAGQRVFNVSINGTQVLTNYDIFADAGAQNKATIKEFVLTPNSSGQIVIQYSTVVDNAKSSGIEILPQ